jgi:cysteine desulfurase
MAKGIYLDNSMTTKPSDKSISSMLAFLTDQWGIPSQPHLMGQELFPVMEVNYKSIYSLLNAKEADHFVLTSSGSEAVNHVFSSAYHDITDPTGKNQYIVSTIDEAASLMALSRLESMGCVARMVKPDDSGKITVESVADTITPRTALVSISWANGLTGVINPVLEIAELCHKRGIAFHVDATHVLGRLFFDLEEIAPTYLTFNGDHLHAPKGTGGLLIKEGIKCSPFILGGLEQAGSRAGNFNMPSLAALGSAVEETMEARDFMCTEIARLRNKLENELQKNLKGITVFFKSEERIPNCSAISFEGIPNELMLYHLNSKGVFASIGGGSFQQIGLILAASGVDENLKNTAINFTLSRNTTDSDIDLAIEIIVKCVHDLRKLSATSIN